MTALAPDLNALLAQREEIDKTIRDVRDAMRADTVRQIRALMQHAGLTVADLGLVPTRPKSTAAGRPAVAVKFADRHGNTWTGRGIQPKWLQEALKKGASLDDFRVS